MLADLAAAVGESTPLADAVRIDRIARLEKLRAATAALQAAESVRFAQSQVAEQLAADVHPESGPTSYSNGRGECERGNLVREMRGWRVEVTDCGFDSAPHKIIITTPTGHHYLSRAPDPP